MTKPAVLMTGSYPDWDLADIESCYRVLRLWEAADHDAFLAEHGSQVRAIATRGDLGASAALMQALPSLEIVACYGVGTDAIDLDHARGSGIRVTNTPDVLTDDVADLAVALLLAAARLIPQGDRTSARAAGRGPLPLTTRVSGKAVGIVGMGRIGAAVAKRLAGFDADIAYFGRTPRSDAPYAVSSPISVALARRSEFLILDSRRERRHLRHRSTPACSRPSAQRHSRQRLPRLDCRRAGAARRARVRHDQGAPASTSSGTSPRSTRASRRSATSSSPRTMPRAPSRPARRWASSSATTSPRISPAARSSPPSPEGESACAPSSSMPPRTCGSRNVTPRPPAPVRSRSRSRPAASAAPTYTITTTAASAPSDCASR